MKSLHHSGTETPRAAAEIAFRACSSDDAEALVALRIAAMRESLERVGRFDPQRARERFLAGFQPELTQWILCNGQIAGFMVLKPQADLLLLDHLYIHPDFQNTGLGASALETVFQRADAAGLPVRVGALRGSASNRFYQRHGFVPCEESEWDLYYLRPARTSQPPAANTANTPRPSSAAGLNAEQLTGLSSSHVREFTLSDQSGFHAHPEAALAFLRMREAAAAERIDLRVASAFRSFDDQLRIWQAKWRGERTLYDAAGQPIDYARLSEAERVDAILEWSALPGTSRHHWGSEFDVFDLAAMPQDYRLKLLPEEYAPDGVFSYLSGWLDRNMARFGFFRPYDAERGGLHIEPWHLSYAPISVPALAALSCEQIHSALCARMIDGASLVLPRLNEIHAKHVSLVASATHLA